MQDIQYPVHFLFHVSTLSNDFTAFDATGRTIGYVRQKMFKLKEDIIIYDSKEKIRINYRIRADRWLDFSAAYTFYDDSGMDIGKIVRKGWRSIWKASYEIIDQYQMPQYTIREENGWVKVMDGLFGEIPVLGLFTGYVFNPSYLVRAMDGRPVVRLKKLPSFFGRKFILEQLDSLDGDDDDRVMLGLMMLILLERRRG
ncbi:MAG: hypothetical protein KDC28_02375 [Saprospiraceae bacterium]|nr:hypothetical protein [Saprospiraceae bacterium]MCB9320288.1 hypothetical protein [Lewinellaceae bacterium]